MIEVTLHQRLITSIFQIIQITEGCFKLWKIFFAILEMNLSKCLFIRSCQLRNSSTSIFSGSDVSLYHESCFELIIMCISNLHKTLPSAWVRSVLGNAQGTTDPDVVCFSQISNSKNHSTSPRATQPLSHHTSNGHKNWKSVETNPYWFV